MTMLFAQVQLANIGSVRGGCRRLPSTKGVYFTCREKHARHNSKLCSFCDQKVV